MNKLIDSEQLKQILLEKGFYPSIVKHAIEECPEVTIDAPDARWIKSRYNGFYTCELCHNCYIEKEWIEDGKWKFCPNCGARLTLDEEKEET